MNQPKQLIFVFASALLIGCGGGGGGSSACSALKINEGESCEGGVPTVAFLEIELAGSAKLTCTGSLISETAVLTAAHCVSQRPRGIAIEVPGYGRAASQYLIHPGYRGPGSPFDLAIIKFSDPIPAGQTPILVSSGPPSVGDSLVAYGYGLDENGDGARGRVEGGDAPLKASSLTFQSNISGLYYETVSDGSGNVCKGDSGGPVLARNQQGEWGIIAVTSFSPELSESVFCVPTQAGSLAVMSPIQNELAMAFVLRHVPDAALN